MLLRNVRFGIRALIKYNFLLEMLFYDFWAPLSEDLYWVQVFDLMLFYKLKFLLIYRPSRHFFIFVTLVSNFCEVFELPVPLWLHAFLLGFLRIEPVCSEYWSILLPQLVLMLDLKYLSRLLIEFLQVSGILELLITAYIIRVFVLRQLILRTALNILLVYWGRLLMILSFELSWF